MGSITVQAKIAFALAFTAFAYGLILLVEALREEYLYRKGLRR